MTRFRTFLLMAGLLGCSVAIAQNPPAPRASAAAYPVSKTQSQYSIGAKMLSKTQIQNSFATPLAGRYVVVEIGLYPVNGKTIDLKQDDFALRTADDKDEVSPASPEEIASILQKRPQGGHDVTLYPEAHVGYESFPIYDGTSVHQAGGPVYGASVGVGVGQSAPVATTDSDRKTMETELRDKQLKDGDVSKPVAGYLYFPISTKDKVQYQLAYKGADAKSNLPLSDH